MGIQVLAGLSTSFSGLSAPGRSRAPTPRNSLSAAQESGSGRAKNLADWTDRIAKGELPQAKPQRPEGLERNIVVTLRDWMDEKHYLHDLIASDKRYPTVNGYGPLLRVSGYSSDNIPILDPVKNTATLVPCAACAIQNNAAQFGTGRISPL